MREIGQLLGDSLARAPWGWALLATVILALIKIWPILAQLSIEAKAKIRGEQRDDLADCKGRLDEMGRRLDATEAAQTELKLQLVGAITAYRILDAEVEADDPASVALRQARAVMSTAFTFSPSTAAARTAPQEEKPE